MRQFTKVSSLIFAGIFLMACQAEPPKPSPLTENIAAPTNIVIGKSVSFPSKILEHNREINIWLPPGYESGKDTYPVLYVVDGGQSQDFQHIAGLAQLGSISSVYSSFIVVGMKSENRFYELTSAATDPRYVKEFEGSGGSDKFTAHLQSELIPYIESQYRTGTRRAIIGESLAGLYISELFLKAPETFTDYLAISPSLWWDDQATAKQSAALLAKHDDTKRGLYLTIANESGTMRSGLEMVMRNIEANTPNGLTWYFVDRADSEGHSTIYHGAALDGLRKLFGEPLPEYGEMPWYLKEDGQP